MTPVDQGVDNATTSGSPPLNPGDRNLNPAGD